MQTVYEIQDSQGHILWDACSLSSLADAVIAYHRRQHNECDGDLTRPDIAAILKDGEPMKPAYVECFRQHLEEACDYVMPAPCAMSLAKAWMEDRHAA